MYKDYIGFGVAGNFAGHLEQANEASDFEEVKVKEVHAPKAIFPFYLPNSKRETFLKKYPLSSDTIRMPATDHNVQIEPEVALICELEYEDHKVVKITPKSFGAYNDCSIRRPDAKKISEKKNWGECSKGLSSQLISIDSFNEGGVLDNYSITSFHECDGELHQYGEVSKASTYSYFHQKLLDWTMEKMNEQKDEGPAENISELLRDSHYPKNCILSIGATRYLPYGESHFLKSGERSIVVVFNHHKYSNDQIIEFIRSHQLEKEEVSFLIQSVK